MFSKNLLAAILLIFSVNLIAQESPEKGIEFEKSSWQEILQKAKDEDKIIFLDAFASWCGPCKWMAKNVFTNDTVAAFYNKNFVNAKIDMEKGEGIELAKKYGVQAYPTLLYINKNGEIVHRTCGSVEPEIFIANGEDALNPQKQLASFAKKYETENSNPEFVFNYVSMLQNACMNYDVELSKYFSQVNEKDLTENANWNLIKNFLTDPASKTFKYLIANRNDFYEKFSKDTVDDKISSVYADGLNNLIRRKNFEKYNVMISELKSSDIATSEKIILSSEMFRLKRNKEWNEFAKVAEEFTEKYGMNDPIHLNSVAWTFYESVKGEAALQKAEKWIKRSVELKDEYFNNDTYAHILFETGKLQEAKIVAEKAIKLAKDSGADYQETEELLNEIHGKIKVSKN